MIPEDYKKLTPEVFSKIKPLTDDPETTDRPVSAASPTAVSAKTRTAKTREPCIIA